MFVRTPRERSSVLKGVQVYVHHHLNDFKVSGSGIDSSGCWLWCQDNGLLSDISPITIDVSPVTTLSLSKKLD